MKNLIVFLCMLSLLFSACKKDLDEPDLNPNEEPSGDQASLEAVIGAAGGKLETKDFIITVPEGAFDTTATLKLTLVESDPSQSAAQVTSTYRLTGLNCNWSKPLEFKIRYDGTLGEESYIALGYNYYDAEIEDSIMVNELFAAVDSQGFLSCIVPPLEVPDSELKFTSEHPVVYHPLALQARLMIRGWSKKIASLQSECVEIKYDPGLSFDRSKVEQFAKDLEEAIYFFHTMGLMKRDVLGGRHKIQVHIFDDARNATQPSFIECNEIGSLKAFDPATQYRLLSMVYKIKIPGSYFIEADNNRLRMVAGEGIFRFENYCIIRERKNWLVWALNSWVREYFYGSNPEFMPGENLYPMFMQPFHGMNAVIKDDPEIFPRNNEYLRTKLHGYGMSSLVKYLFDNYNENFDLLPKIYLGLQAESGTQHPIDVIFNCIEDPEYIWWPGFLKEYLIGSIWDVPAKVFLDKINSSDKVHFMDEADTVRHFDRSYMDLSARLCQVNLSKDLSEYVLGDGDKMNFKLGPKSLNMDYVKVLVYKYKEGQLTFLGEGQDVTIDNVKGLIDNGDTTLLAAVVNSANEYPYEEEMNIELTIKMVKERIWPWKYVSLDALVNDAILRSNSGVDYLWEKFTYEMTDQELTASEDGTRFTASWLDQASNYKVEGGIDITVDTVTYEITGFYAWGNSESISDNVVTLSVRGEIRGKEGIRIPVVYWDDDFLSHQVTGEEVCSVIDKWTYVYSSYPGESYEMKNTLVSYSCDYDANLMFFWSRETKK